jgi:hypothetical protein
MIWLIIISILISIGDVLTSVPIGGNLDILDFGSRSQPYVNLVRQSHAWGNASSHWGPGATVDPTTGWPTSDFGVILSASAVDLGGTYLLYAKGNAQVSVFGNYRAYIIRMLILRLIGVIEHLYLGHNIYYLSITHGKQSPTLQITLINPLIFGSTFFIWMSELFIRSKNKCYSSSSYGRYVYHITQCMVSIWISNT